MSSSTTSGSAAIGAPPSMKLSRDNFLHWQAQILPTLRGARAMALLEGKEEAPSEYLEAEDANHKKIVVPNPAYDAWILKDQQVMGFLVNSLSDDVLAEVFGLEHAADVWKALLALYSTQSKAKVSALRGALTNTKKLDMTASQFLTKMKGFASELAQAGKKVDDDELKDYILNGLDGTYNPLVASVNANPATTLQDMCSQLLSYEYRENMLTETGQNTGTFTSSVNAAQHRRPSFSTNTPAKPPLLPSPQPYPTPYVPPPAPYTPPPPPFHPLMSDLSLARIK